MALAFQILTAASLLAGSGVALDPALGIPASWPRLGHPASASSLAPAFLAPDPSRILPANAGRAPRGALRLAVVLGASLAWDLADLPRRHARLPEPVGGFPPGPGFQRADLNGFAGGTRPDDAIAALITRWNRLYPPYAFDRDEP
jgi:hypothetical protein